jgi:hypothetical protein
VLDLSITYINRFVGEATISYVVRIGEFFSSMPDNEWAMLDLPTKTYSNNIIKYIMNNRLY